MITEKIYWAIIVVLIGALLGFGSYHLIETSALKSNLKTKDKEIAALVKEKAELGGENVALRAANSQCASTITKQTVALEALKKERDDATKKWQDAEARAAKDSVASQRRVDAILAAQPKPGQTWCDTWKGLVDDYFKGPQ